ncbi:MAG TPA: hypothetical protein VJ917_00385 [Saprospiraceae bacterium]|nr:hypothetical protein [Saprospiraceae bacterium]
MENLKKMLAQYEITVEKEEDNFIWTQGHFCIEVEGNGLYKLLHLGDVIAPFDDPNALCHFIMQYSS